MVISTNKAKHLSETDGKKFLTDSFCQEQALLTCQLELSSQSITHSGTLGEISERCIIEFLKKYMPTRYSVNSGIVIDSNGKTSDQIDIIIYDNQYTTTMLDQQEHRYVPAEAVYAIIEVKQTINKEYIEYAGNKAKSVRCLERTSIEIPHAGGIFPAKPPLKIVAGLISLSCSWADGIRANAFTTCLNSLSPDCMIDFGIALKDRAFDSYNKNKQVFVSSSKCSLAFFLFRLLGQLQSMGTVPAIDWTKYAQALSSAD